MCPLRRATPTDHTGSQVTDTSGASPDRCQNSAGDRQTATGLNRPIRNSRQVDDNKHCQPNLLDDLQLVI